ncbi:uncharacterized protein LOC135837301 [Planococcus citri]|uniref:uncharacterized protein LOC135837301 n=1 Tax=Planococcus citri TaxID=170843 RepID=UPI0031F72E14
MMYYHRKVWILFFILLQRKKGVFSTQEISSENDITKHLNESITNILAIGVENATEIISTVKDHKLMEFEYNISKPVDQFQTKLFFQNITMVTYINSEPREWIPPQIHLEFLENKISLFYEDLRFTLDATIGTVKGEDSSIIRAYPGFRNFTLIAVRSNVENDDLKFSYNITYSGFRDWMSIIPRINWYNNSNALTQTDLNKLALEMMPASLEMILENIHNNRNFSRSLEEIFQTYEKPRKEIISKHPDFMNNQQEYYYLIAEYPFMCFALKDIVIGGLSNFESFKLIRRTSGIFTHTLLIRDVRGKMTLDYRSENEPDLELNFQIDHLFVSKKDDSGCIFVHAKYYTVTRTETNVSLSGLQSEVIMNGMESAMASALFPSMRAARICDHETSLNNIKISNTSDWETIKEIYKGWIPFNDDYSVSSTPATHSENDITKYVNDSITNIFAIDVQNVIELSSIMEYFKLKEFEYDISENVSSFQTKFFFHNITMWRCENIEAEELTPPQMHWEFLENKMSLFYEDFGFILRGMIDVGAVKGQNLSIIVADPVSFRNFTLTAVRSHIEDGDLQFAYNTTHTHNDIQNLENRIRFTPDLYRSDENVSTSDKQRLAQQIMSASQAMMLENLHKNRNFAQALKDIFQVYEKPRKDIISKHTDFINSPHQYYYFIPEHTFVHRFILKNIFIGGLSNFKSFKLIRRPFEIFTHTLLIRDVRGKMTLDYRSDNETDLELNFQIDCLFVSKKDDSGCVLVQAKYYTVTRTETNVSLNARQSEVIMDGLESAIALSLFPSMNAARICDREIPLNNIKISNTSDWKTVQESYKEWIPFNEGKITK